MTFYHRIQFFLKCNSEETKKLLPGVRTRIRTHRTLLLYTIISPHQRTETNMETYIAEKLKNTLEICLRGIAQLFNKWLLHIALVSLGCCNKHKRLDSLNNRICFSHFWRMEVWDQVPTWFIWWEHTSWLACGWFLAASSNGLFMSIEKHTHRGRERERKLFLFL